MPSRVLALHAIDDRPLQCLFLLRRHRRLAVALQAVLPHNRDDTSSLLATHDRDPRARPQEGEAGVEGRAAHGIIASAKAATTNNGDLGHGHVAHSVDHLCTILRDTALLVGGTDDEASDVMEEDQRHSALATDLDEVCGLDRGLTEEHAVVAEDANGVALDVGPTAYHRRPILRLELVEARSIDEAGYDFPDVKWNVRALWDDTQEALGIVDGRLGLRAVQED
mmetsp:Transcript_38842/g.82603  ORF Transcript_38842/g.82603 Transcript_38842/m.82603 type:complete len:224 (-) Transcript_38842:2400-3071(-)